MTDRPERNERLDWNDPAMLPFLPMIYVAWADGHLSAEEMESICRRLQDDCGSRFAPWLDPSRPPSAEDLAHLLHQIRRAAAGLETRERLTLTELGLRLAAVGDLEVSDAERAALIEIEKALEIDGHEVARHLLATRRPARLPEYASAGFEPSALAAWLDGERRELRQRIRSLLAEPEWSLRSLPDKKRYREQILLWCRRLADEGLGALSFPEAVGGADDLDGFVVAFETLAMHDLSLLVKFGVQFGLFGGSILNLGSERHHRELLPAVASLELPGCFAMTETGHGSNVQDIETTARFDPSRDLFVLNTPHDGARKDYIGNAAEHGRMATVFAQLQVPDPRGTHGTDWLDHGVHAFLVRLRDDDGQVLPGITIEDCGRKLGLNGVDNGRIAFDQVPVPRLQMLDRFAQVGRDGTYDSHIRSPSKRFFTMLGTLVGGRVSVAHAAVTASKVGLTIAIRYNLKRRQFGAESQAEVQILDYLTQQRRLFPSLARTYALHVGMEELRRRFRSRNEEDTEATRELEALAAGFKAVATWHANEILQACRECCGGQGYLWVNRFADLRGDADVFATFEGDNVVLLQLMAKSLLNGFRRQFSRMGIWDLLRWAGRRARHQLVESNPIAARRTDPEHLRDAAFQSAALRFRAEHLLVTVAKRLRGRIQGGQSSLEALVACQDHLVSAARAEVETRLLDLFVSAVDRAPEALRPVLSRLRELHGLAELERDRAFFLEEGYFEPAKARAIRSEVNQLCRETRPDADALVEAFAIPEALLKPTIGRR